MPELFCLKIWHIFQDASRSENPQPGGEEVVVERGLGLSLDESQLVGPHHLVLGQVGLDLGLPGRAPVFDVRILERVHEGAA